MAAYCRKSRSYFVPIGYSLHLEGCTVVTGKAIYGVFVADSAAEAAEWLVLYRQAVNVRSADPKEARQLATDMIFAQRAQGAAHYCAGVTRTICQSHWQQLGWDEAAAADSCRSLVLVANPEMGVELP